MNPLICGLTANELTPHIVALNTQLLKGTCVAANYGFVELEKGTSNILIHNSYNTVCIADVASRYEGYHRVANTPVCVVYNLLYDKSLSKDRLLWCNWVCMESPWHNSFAMLDTFNPELNACLVARADISSNYKATALNILRIGIENSTTLNRWVSMVKAGVNKNLAFTLCLNNVNTCDAGIIVGEKTSYWSHSILNNTYIEGMLRMLCGKTLPNEGYEDKPYYTRRTYRGASERLGGLEGKTVLSMLIAKYSPKHEKVYGEEDLMGRKEKLGEGYLFSVEQLNKFWSDYVSAD